MDIVLFIITLLFIVFLGTCIHECGHAIGAKWCNYYNVVVSIGDGKKCFSFRWLEIEWNVHQLFFLGGHTSYESTTSYRPLDIAVISMMGPLFNGFVVFMLIMFTNIYVHNGLYVFFLFNAWLILGNSIPMKWQEKKSDGYIALKMIVAHMRTDMKD